ncbi:SDR family oxidoreductase [Amnibacterium kyonggiense]|uniref:NADP-dependent 3-hydroxy acid dehydrogenase YdfG n=1 Tax=Amnibacterium kyonggiense TaxID=595671 RepID=A0A4V3EBA3_9MICO|nr:SDR family NAD(P)-dependent oxidoreductase [Amnibacterium kyonggiense]TDS80244.1 NADP-dependent 3-hydroxy acid dehydrogenase YdfG [Amnibacterium kyonggiense]
MAAQDRVTWVTGAGSGMGRAAALAAARSGRAVALSGRRADRLAEVRATIEAAGGRALAVPGDTTDPAWAGEAAAAVLGAWGRIDEVVVAAGLNEPRRRWDDQSMAGFEAVVATNLTGVARVVDAALPALRERGGTVVVVSSYAAWTFSAGSGVAYSASKTALGPLCRTLNAQEGAHGVRATHLCPGDVDTDFLAQRPVVPDADARAVMLTPDDVARSVLHVLDAPPHVRIDELVISPVAQR